jgi:succinyl-diaminopimelate desuccinylase
MEGERAEWRKLPATDEGLARELGVSVAGLAGEQGYTSIERKWARPTLEVHGLTCGYQGAGAKTVLPCEASAKFSCRLVPNQEPGKVTRSVEAYVRKLISEATGGAGAAVEFHVHGAGSPPAITPLNSLAMQAAAEALEIGYGTRPIMMREGGSIPVVAWFKEALGLDTIMVGFGLPGDRLHAPNEKLDLACYFGGIKTAAALYERLGERLK